jgi:hypothetical protein
MAVITRAAERRDGCRPTVTSTSWMLEQVPTLPEWLEHGQRLGLVGRGVAWWIGDWLRFGNATYGERYDRASRVTGYDQQTLMNMVYVASRFESARRRERLSWSHHAEVAALDVGDQERWLDLAERERMSVRSLRIEVSAARLTVRRAALGSATPIAKALVCPNCNAVIEPP